MRERATRDPEAGFSLAEVLMALAVFSIAALALLNLGTQNARAAGAARDRAVASIVAENVMVEAMAAPGDLDVGRMHGQARMDGRDWDWTRAVLETGETGMVRVDVAVRIGGQEHVAAALSGFRAQ